MDTTTFKSVVNELPQEVKDGVRVAAIKSSAGFGIWGLTLETWIAILTALYFVLQIGLLLMRYWHEFPPFWSKVKAWRAGKQEQGDENGKQ